MRLGEVALTLMKRRWKASGESRTTSNEAIGDHDYRGRRHDIPGSGIISLLAGVVVFGVDGMLLDILLLGFPEERSRADGAQTEE